jgi:hypothetical protein
VAIKFLGGGDALLAGEDRLLAAEAVVKARVITGSL